MIEHVFHAPAQRRNIEVKPATRPGACPYCHVGTIKHNQCDRCGIWTPSPLTEVSPEKLKRLAAARKKAQATEYRPQFDGLCDPDPAVNLIAALPWD